MVDSLLNVMILATQRAKKSGKSYFVIRDRDRLLISDNYEKGWLFRAYPGGRKILSVIGKEYLDKTGEQLPNS